MTWSGLIQIFVKEICIMEYGQTGYLFISLSTIVLNSRDWSEIVWLPEISHLKINHAIGFIRKKTRWNALVRL